MPRVFTGRVVIPGDKLEEYFKLLEEAEKRRAPFKQLLSSLNAEFYDHLAGRFSDRTARKHSGIVGLFIDFLCRYTDVEKIEDVTRGMVNTHFQKWWRRKVIDTSKPEDRRIALMKFFEFLAEHKGIVNQKVLDALQ